METDQTIFRIVRRENPFVQVDRAVVEDDRLSWKAKGVLCYLLSRPSDWRVMLEDLSARSTDGITAVRSALQELRRLGYAKIKVVHASGGQLGGKVWTIFEVPNRADIQETLMSVADIEVLRTSGKPNVGESPTTNKDRNKEEPKTKKGEEFEIPISLQTPQFQIAWAEWLAYRKEKKAAVTPLSAKKQFELLVKLGPDRAVLSITQSIQNTWTGLFEPRANFSNGSTPQKPNSRDFAGHVTDYSQYVAPEPRLESLGL